MLLGFHVNLLFLKMAKCHSCGTGLPGSLALTTMAIERGASIIRTHDVAATKQTVDLAFFQC